MNGDSYVSSRAAVNARHPPNAELSPAKPAAGEKGRFRYAPAPFSPAISTTLTSNYCLLLLRPSGLVLLRP